MPPALVRLAIRRTTWSGETAPEDVVRIEFRDRETGGVDLTPSFYLLADGLRKLVQAHAEHSASLLDRPEGRVHVDAQGVESPAPVQTPGETLFRFTREEAHREIRFRDEADLLVFVRRILAGGGPRRVSTTADDLLEYVGVRLDAKDEEWMDACTSNEKAKKWPKQVEKMRKKKAALPVAPSVTATPPKIAGDTDQ